MLCSSAVEKERKQGATLSTRASNKQSSPGVWLLLFLTSAQEATAQCLYVERGNTIQSGQIYTPSHFEMEREGKVFRGKHRKIRSEHALVKLWGMSEKKKVSRPTPDLVEVFFF